MKKLLKEEPIQERIETQAACHNAGISLTATGEASNEEALRGMLDLLPTLKERLHYLQRNKGFVVSRNERNALILLAVRRLRMDNDSLNRDNVRLRKQVKSLSQLDMFSPNPPF